jgi:hypothetical protein
LAVKKSYVEATYATKEALKNHTDAADKEFAKLVGIGGDEEPATVAELVDDKIVELNLDKTYAKIDDSYTKDESDGKYATKAELEAHAEAADKKYYAVKTKDEGIRLINEKEIEKLSKLNIEDGEITISGSVNASQVKELYSAVVNIVKGSTTDLDAETDGNQLGLNIEEGAQVNKIEKIKVNGLEQSISADKSVDLSINLDKISSDYASATAIDVITDSGHEGYIKIAGASSNNFTYIGEDRTIKVYHTSGAVGDVEGYTVEGKIATLEEVDQKVANATVKWTEM